MDNELIAMCSDERIQSKCEPVMGGLFYTAAVMHVIAMVRNTGKFTLVDRPQHGEWELYRTEGLFIPSIETVLEWLGGKFAALFFHGKLRVWGAENIYGLECRSDMPIKALLKAFMHLEHSATWDGERWK